MCVFIYSSSLGTCEDATELSTYKTGATIVLLITFVSVLDKSLIDVLLFGDFQDVEEAQVDSVRLFHDEVQQRLGGFDWTTSERLN